jgi:putative intracellular protease/amidase
VFGQGRVEVVTVARSTAPITTAMGMKVVPSRSFESCPPVDVLIIPGGDVGGVENDASAIAWLRERADQAQFVLSVCNGAFILAKTGLLDGLTATTFYNLIDTFASRYPKVHAVSDRRYVDNGKFVTTAGISSGIDGSLHVIAKLRGESAAECAALNMEYNWSPHTDFARAALADRYLRTIFERNLRLRILDDVAPQLVHTRGDRSTWEAEWRLSSTLPSGELLARLDRTVAERGRWARSGQAAATHGDALRQSAWRFEDGGTAWLGVTEVERETDPRRYRIRVRVTRA